MRNTTNMLIVSHLSAEMAASSFGIVTQVLLLVIDKKPSVGSVGCVVETAIIRICLGGGLLSLLCITIDRYLALVMKIHHRITRGQVQVALAVIWTLSIAYGIPWRFIFFDARMRRDYIAWLIVNCHVQIGNLSAQPPAVDIFQCVVIATGYVLPLVTIVFTSFRIFHTVLKARRRVGVIRTSVNHITAAYMRSASTTILIVSVYFLCLIPTFALAAKCKNDCWKCKSRLLFFFAKATLCFRSACFPVIYAARNRNFSRYLHRFLCKRAGLCERRHCFEQYRRRNSSKVHNGYHYSSSSRINNGNSEITAGTSNLGTRAFSTGTRKLAFVDLQNIAP